MQVSVNIDFEQLVNIIKALPDKQKAKIKKELDDKTTTHKSSVAKNEFQDFLLKGPVMTDEEFDAFKNNRKKMNQWRNKQSA